MGIFGFGIGIGYFPLINIAWKYFPEKKGFLSGLILCSFGMGSFFWIFIAEKIINPNNLAVEDKGPNKDYFDPKSPVSSNIVEFWKYMIFIAIVFTIIITLLGFDYYEDEDEEIDNKQELISHDNNTNENSKIDTKLILTIIHYIILYYTKSYWIGLFQWGFLNLELELDIFLF